MPFGDRTGPWGGGPMTGRAAGYCAGFGTPGYMNPHPGYGMGRGWGRGFGGGGRGWRHRFWATGLPGRARGGMAPGWDMEPHTLPYTPEFSPEQEIKVLRAQAKQMEQTLNEMRKHIVDLEAEGDKDQ